MKFRGAALTLKPAARMDIEIFGLDPTSKFHIPQPDRPLTQIWECHVTYLPKKDRILMCELPLPPAGTGHGRIEPADRHGDVADRPDNFCSHVRDSPSNPSHQ